MKAIDTSSWNQDLDFEKIKKDGIEGIIIRAGYGSNSRDKYFVKNVKKALEYGLSVGAYWFMYCTNVEEAIKEADYFNVYLQEFKGKLTLPVFADYEYDSERYARQVGVNVTPSLRTAMVKAFCERLQSYGWYVGNYANLDYIKNKWNQIELDKFDLWYADWREFPDTDYVRKSGIHQYTENGPQYGSGIATTDMNTINKNYPKIIRDSGLNGLVKSQISTSKLEPLKDINVIAREVIAAKWGNGEERKQKLTQAGYNYNKVQDIVNSLLIKKSTDEIAKEVISGIWGNGQERIKRLTDAGYNAIKIQTTVNGLLNDREYEEVAKKVIDGDYGNGNERKKRLSAEGYDFYKVQEKVNKLI
ncbi:GH25 family lysozyme [Helcococcus bovis]|uniref:GH25 family lysozyme n=1 Tax=Helcococcus bovis TaxID=3153252 RepID=UPI0038BA8B53